MPALYPYLLDPGIFPDFTRRCVRVPTWDTFNHAVQFITLRGFTIKKNRLINWREDLDAYTKHYKLGKIIWPVFQTVFTENFKELVREIKQRELYLFDIWGHVPGSATDGMWGHVMPPNGMVQYLSQELGDHFLGFDNGEQDGRYVGKYALQQCPSPDNRFQQYLNFHRHFERMGDDLGNQMTALVSLCFGHYFLKEGNHLLLGAETAQALPNSQVYYAFIRGAGKQYGVIWFGNASVYNRWGFKTYESEGKQGHYLYGPKEGTSLILLRRLIYTHIFYNSVAVGFEQNWISQDNNEKRLAGIPTVMEKDRANITLSPIGEIQAAAVRYIEAQGQPGVMHAPVALLLDHFAGWVMPRHLYTDKVFQVWGALPYGDGDYLTHGVISMLYPGYENSGFFRDERGFLSPTPYGDMADCVLSDVPAWVLKQYGLLVAAGELMVDDELRDKIKAFIERGGHFIVTAVNARKLWPQLKISEGCIFSAGSIVKFSKGLDVKEESEFELYQIELPEKAEVLASCNKHPSVIRLAYAEGMITILLSPFGINKNPLNSDSVLNQVEHSLDCPFKLLNHVRHVLGEAFAGQQILSVGEGLGYITCRKSTGEYLVCIYNNNLSARPFKITSKAGSISGIKELIIDDQPIKAATGYWPGGMEKNDGGISDATTIAGGDVRVFRVTIEEKDIRFLERVSPPPPVAGRLIAYRGMGSLQETILKWPTFFQHFDGVKIEWNYLFSRDIKQLEREREWILRNKIRLMVDFSAGLNHYPDLTLLDTLDFRYRASMDAMEDVFKKMQILNSTEAILCLNHHCGPRNKDELLIEERFKAGMYNLCKTAARYDVILYLQHHPEKWRPTGGKILEFIEEINEANLKFALNTGHAVINNESIDELAHRAGTRLGAILANAPACDRFGQYYDAHLPISNSVVNLKPLSGLNVPIVLDADYDGWNAIYHDAIEFPLKNNVEGANVRQYISRP